MAKAPKPFKGIADESIVKELDNQSPRATAIVAASVVELYLENILEKHLVQSKVLVEFISGSKPNAPLGTFASKIKACYLLGLISEEMFNDLEIVRKIRNVFAHQIHGCDFSDNNIRSLIKNFYFVYNCFGDIDKHPPRMIFMLEMMALGVALTKKIVRTTRITKLQCEISDLGFEDKDYEWMHGSK